MKHEHSKDPGTFVQLAFEWHGRISHSLLSRIGKTNINSINVLNKLCFQNQLVNT
jgi:hypothetical protein